MLTFLTTSEASSQNLVLDFAKKFKSSCPEASNILSKKLLIQTIKSNGHLNCKDELIVNRYFKKCQDGFSCKQSNSVYQEIKALYSGNVIGGK